MKHRRVIGIVILVIALIAGGYWLWLTLQIDSCLDNGGRWNHQQSACEFV